MPLPTDLPAARTMQSLGMLIHGPDLADSGQDILVTVPGGGTWCVLNAELDELWEKGWIDLSKDEHVTVTQQGIYWYGRWQKEQKKCAS